MPYMVEDYFNISSIHKDISCIIQCMKDNNVPKHLSSIIRLKTPRIKIGAQAQNGPREPSEISIFLNNTNLTNHDVQALMDALELYPEFANKIVHLELSDNKLNFVNISGKLTALQTLDLGGNRLTSFSFVIPSSLNKIKYLNLEENRISSFIIPIFLAELCDLKVAGNSLTTITKIMLNYFQFIKGFYIDQDINPNEEVFNLTIDLDLSSYTLDKLTIEHFDEHCKKFRDEVSFNVAAAIINIKESSEMTLDKLIDYLRVILMSENLLRNALTKFQLTFTELFQDNNQQLIKQSAYFESPIYESNIKHILTLPNRLDMVCRAMSAIQDELLEEAGSDFLNTTMTYLQKDKDFAFLLAQELLHNVALETKLSADNLGAKISSAHNEKLVDNLIKWVFSLKGINTNLELEPRLHILIYGSKFFAPSNSYLARMVENIYFPPNQTQPLYNNYKSKVNKVKKIYSREPQNKYFLGLPRQIRHDIGRQQEISPRVKSAPTY